jgi:hypothetical protein
MSTTGIQGLYIETHNWGATVGFWQELGYKLTFETDHHSGQLVHPDSGVYLFVNERPESEALDIHPIVDVAGAEGFVPPAAGEVAQPFAATHWHTQEMVLRDPDGRTVSLQAPPAGDGGEGWAGSGGPASGAPA